MIVEERPKQSKIPRIVSERDASGSKEKINQYVTVVSVANATERADENSQILKVSVCEDQSVDEVKVLKEIAYNSLNLTSASPGKVEMDLNKSPSKPSAIPVAINSPKGIKTPVPKERTRPQPAPRQFVTVVSVGGSGTLETDNDGNTTLETNLRVRLDVPGDKEGQVDFMKGERKMNLSHNDTDQVIVFRLPGERLGMGLKFDGGMGATEKVKRLFIQSVAPDSPAARATVPWGDLEPGDQILNIEGCDVSSLTRVECVSKLKDASVKLTIGVVKGNGTVPETAESPKVPQSKIGVFNPNSMNDLKRRLPPPPLPPRSRVCKTPARPPKEFGIPPPPHGFEDLDCDDSYGNDLEINEEDDFAEELEYTYMQRTHRSIGSLPPAPAVYMDLFSQDGKAAHERRESESDETNSSASTVVDRLSLSSSRAVSRNSSFNAAVDHAKFDLARALSPFEQLEKEFGTEKRQRSLSTPHLTVDNSANSRTIDGNLESAEKMEVEESSELKKSPSALGKKLKNSIKSSSFSFKSSPYILKHPTNEESNSLPRKSEGNDLNLISRKTPKRPAPLPPPVTEVNQNNYFSLPDYSKYEVNLVTDGSSNAKKVKTEFHNANFEFLSSSEKLTEESVEEVFIDGLRPEQKTADLMNQNSNISDSKKYQTSSLLEPESAIIIKTETQLKSEAPNNTITACHGKNEATDYNLDKFEDKRHIDIQDELNEKDLSKSEEVKQNQDQISKFENLLNASIKDIPLNSTIIGSNQFSLDANSESDSSYEPIDSPTYLSNSEYRIDRVSNPSYGLADLNSKSPDSNKLDEQLSKKDIMYEDIDSNAEVKSEGEDSSDDEESSFEQMPDKSLSFGANDLENIDDKLKNSDLSSDSTFSISSTSISSREMEEMKREEMLRGGDSFNNLDLSFEDGIHKFKGANAIDVAISAKDDNVSLDLNDSHEYEEMDIVPIEPKTEIPFKTISEYSREVRKRDDIGEIVKKKLDIEGDDNCTVDVEEEEEIESIVECESKDELLLVLRALRGDNSMCLEEKWETEGHNDQSSTSESSPNTSNKDLNLHPGPFLHRSFESSKGTLSEERSYSISNLERNDATNPSKIVDEVYSYSRTESLEQSATSQAGCEEMLNTYLKVRQGGESPKKFSSIVRNEIGDIEGEKSPSEAEESKSESSLLGQSPSMTFEKKVTDPVTSEGEVPNLGGASLLERRSLPRDTKEKGGREPELRDPHSSICLEKLHPSASEFEGINPEGGRKSEECKSTSPRDSPGSSRGHKSPSFSPCHSAPRGKGVSPVAFLTPCNETLPREGQPNRDFDSGLRSAVLVTEEGKRSLGGPTQHVSSDNEDSTKLIASVRSKFRESDRLVSEKGSGLISPSAGVQQGKVAQSRVFSSSNATTSSSYSFLDTPNRTENWNAGIQGHQNKYSRSSNSERRTPILALLRDSQWSKGLNTSCSSGTVGKASKMVARDPSAEDPDVIKSAANAISLETKPQIDEISVEKRIIQNYEFSSKDQKSTATNDIGGIDNPSYMLLKSKEGKFSGLSKNDENTSSQTRDLSMDQISRKSETIESGASSDSDRGVKQYKNGGDFAYKFDKIKGDFETVTEESDLTRKSNGVTYNLKGDEGDKCKPEVEHREGISSEISKEYSDENSSNLDDSGETQEQIGQHNKGTNGGVSALGLYEQRCSSSNTTPQAVTPPSYSRLPPDGHEFPSNYSEGLQDKINRYARYSHLQEECDSSSSPSSRYSCSSGSPATLPRSPTKADSKCTSRWRRQDERSEKSVRDKIAMFSHEKEARLNGQSRKLDRSESISSVSSEKVIMKRSLTEDDVRIEANGHDLKFDKNTTALTNGRGLGKTSAFSSMINVNTPSYTETKEHVKPRRVEPVSVEKTTKSKKESSSQKIKTKVKAREPREDGTISSRLSSRSQSLIDIGKTSRAKRHSVGAYDRPSAYKYGLEKPEEQERRTSLNNLIEQRRKSMSKLRGLVIPEARSTETPEQKFPLDLPRISSSTATNSIKTMSLPREESRSSRLYKTDSISSIDSCSSSASRHSSTHNGIIGKTKVSPAVNRKNSLASSKHDSLPPVGSRTYRTHSPSSEFSATSSTSRTVSPQRSSDRANTPNSDMSFEADSKYSNEKTNYMKLQKNSYDSRHGRGGEDSDNDSAVSSTQSSFSQSLSPRASPMPDHYDHDDRHSPTRAMRVQHSPQSSLDELDGKRVLKTGTIEAENRRNILKSAKCSSGRSSDEQSTPEIVRKYSKETPKNAKPFTDRLDVELKDGPKKTGLVRATSTDSSSSAASTDSASRRNSRDSVIHINSKREEVKLSAEPVYIDVEGDLYKESQVKVAYLNEIVDNFEEFEEPEKIVAEIPLPGKQWNSETENKTKVSVTEVKTHKDDKWSALEQKYSINKVSDQEKFDSKLSKYSSSSDTTLTSERSRYGQPKRTDFKSLADKWKQRADESSTPPQVEMPRRESAPKIERIGKSDSVTSPISTKVTTRYNRSFDETVLESNSFSSRLNNAKGVRPNTLNLPRSNVSDRKFSVPEYGSNVKLREKRESGVGNDIPSRPTSLIEGNTPIDPLQNENSQYMSSMSPSSTSTDSREDLLDSSSASLSRTGSKEILDVFSKPRLNIPSSNTPKMSEIMMAFERHDLSRRGPLGLGGGNGNNGNGNSSHPRMSSLDSNASDDNGAIYGSVTSLASGQRDQYGSITSLSSCTSIISPQELAQLIDEANQSLEESGTPSHEILVVVLHREIVGHGSIGITLAGGADYETKEVTVHKVIPGSLADRDGRIQKGDRVLSINGKTLRGVTHREALNILKSPRPEVVLVLSRSRSVTPQESTQTQLSADSDFSFNHRPVYVNHMVPPRPPKILESPMDSKSLVSDVPLPQTPRGPPMTIALTKDGAGLGFSLEGGKDSPLGDRPLTVKKVFTGGAADKGGILLVGDELLSVNSVDLTQMARIEAWNFLKKLPDGKVTLVIKKKLKEGEAEAETSSNVEV